MQRNIQIGDKVKIDNQIYTVHSVKTDVIFLTNGDEDFLGALVFENGIWKPYGTYGTNKKYNIEYLAKDQIDINIMLMVSDNDLNSLCRTNKELANICANDDFWRQRVLKYYPNSTKTNYQTWKELYISLK